MTFFAPAATAVKRPFPVTMILLLVGLASFALVFLQSYHNTLIHEREEKARRLVENATSLIAYYESKTEKGEMNEEKAKYYALETIRQIMPEPNGYFWVIDTTSHGVMHPLRPKWEGEDLSGYVGPDGRHLFLDVVQIAQKNKDGDYVRYAWAKPDKADTRPYDKVSFIQLYQPWRWIIGTGVYVEDIESAFWNAVLITCGLSVAILMFVMALAMTISESLRKTNTAL